jgi:hypothetical protein
MNANDGTFAIFRNRDEVKVAVHSFLKLGFNKSALWVFQSKLNHSKDFFQFPKYQVKTCLGIGAIVGAIIVGTIATVSIGELSGGLWTMMAVGIPFGALFGAAAGTLVGIGIPDPAAKRYGQYLRSGGILLSVHSNSPKQVRQANEILSATGGQDIQLMNELKTWNKAKLEMIDLEKMQVEAQLHI